MTTNPESLTRDFFLGFIKVHILHHAAEEPIYGLAMIEELRRHGYELSAGTMYPLLHALEKAGYLSKVNRNIEGKIRKYYHITDAGLSALTEARPRIRELVDEVFSDPT